MAKLDMFAELFSLVRDIYFAIVDVALGRLRRRYEFVMVIDAPSEKVWQCLWSPGTLSHLLGFTYRVDPVSGKDHVFALSLSVYEENFVSELQVLDQREGEAVLIERKPVSSNWAEDEGSGDLHAIAIEETEFGTNLRIFSQLVFRNFWQRIVNPLAMRWLIRSIKLKCETPLTPTISLELPETISGIASASVAFVGCWYFYDITWALVLFLILAIHEFGHVLAVRWLGMPISGIYMVPFLGGTYLSKSGFRSLLDNAFCFLMGPALSLLPASILYLTFVRTGDEIFGISAALCALVNLLNFLPVIPFDGGQVARSIIGSVKKQDAVVAGWACLIIGLSISYLNGSYIFGALVAFAVYQIWDLIDQRPTQEEPMSMSGLLLVTISTILIGTLHAIILIQTMSDGRISEFLGLS